MHIFWQNLRLGRANLLGFGLGLAFLALTSVLFLPSLKESGAQLEQLLQSMPKQFLAVFGVSDTLDFLTPEGFLQGRLFAFLVPLVLLIQGIGIGAGTLAGEEERGQLEMVAAHPLARARLFLEKLAVLAAALAFSGLLLFLSVWLGVLAVNVSVGAGAVAAAVFASFLLGLLFGGVALAIGAWTGRRALAAGAASGLAAVAYLWNALTPLSRDLADLQRLSPFYLGGGYEPIKNGLDLGHSAVLLAVTLALLGLGLYRFARRDLGV